MTRTDTAALKRAIDLRKLVAETHKLKNGKISCPFHHEKTASCSINKQFYKCFGCDAKGDAISWLQHLGLTFREAVAELEQRAGMSVSQVKVRAPREAATLAIEVAEWYNGLSAFFQSFLEAFPDNDHMQSIYEAHRTAQPAEIVTAYRRVRTPWLAAQLRAAAQERDNFAAFFRSAIQ